MKIYLIIEDLSNDVYSSDRQVTGVYASNPSAIAPEDSEIVEWEVKEVTPETIATHERQERERVARGKELDEKRLLAYAEQQEQAEKERLAYRHRATLREKFESLPINEQERLLNLNTNPKQ